jgi:FMN-dependent NADH-azoreductase
VFASFTPPESRTDAQKAAVAMPSELTDEPADADAMIFAVPLCNLGASTQLTSVR